MNTKIVKKYRNPYWYEIRFSIFKNLLYFQVARRSGIWNTIFESSAGNRLRRDYLFGINRVFARDYRKYLYEFHLGPIKVTWSWRFYK